MEKNKRPKVTKGNTYKIRTGCGSIYISPNRNNEGKLIEVFATLGKAGGCAHCQLEAITRCVSLGLRYNVPIEEFIDQLRGINCPSIAMDSGKEVLSCPDAIAKVLKGEFEGENNNNSTD